MIKRFTDSIEEFMGCKVFVFFLQVHVEFDFLFEIFFVDGLFEGFGVAEFVESDQIL